MIKKFVFAIIFLLFFVNQANAVVVLLWAKDRAARLDLAGKGACYSPDGNTEYVEYENNQAACEGNANVFLPFIEHTANKGYFVGVFPDTHVFSQKESLPPISGGSFVRIGITDKTVEQASKYLQNHEIGEFFKKRGRWRVLVDNLPVGVRQQLNQTGYYENTWDNIRGYVYDSVTDTTE